MISETTGQAGGFAHLGQKPQPPPRPDPGSCDEWVRGLESAATQDIGPGPHHQFGGLYELGAALYGAGPGDDADVLADAVAANLRVITLSPGWNWRESSLKGSEMRCTVST